MSYVPGAGIKKPLNLLTGPVYPDIRKGPPRFAWSGKHWKVDAGATLRDTEAYTQFIEPAVLAVSRDYNKTQYGVTSFKDIVNAEFRPPLSNVYEDAEPLTRMPTKMYAIVPLINPSTAGHDGGTSSYTAQNERSNNVEKALTDRVKTASSRPTIYCPMEIPIDNSVLPDLEMTLPQVSAHAGWTVPFLSSYDDGSIYVTPLDDKLSTPLISGQNPGFTVDGGNVMEHFQLGYHNPQVSAHSGNNFGFTIDGSDAHQMTPINFNLGYVNPQVSATSGYNSNLNIDGEHGNISLDYHNPQVSASAGYTSGGFTANGENYGITRLFDYVNPQVSATSGFTAGVFTANGEGYGNVTQLDYNNPQVSATSGFTAGGFTANGEGYGNVTMLDYVNPQVSAGAGFTAGGFTADAETPVLELTSKLGNVPINVTNPGTDLGYSQLADNLSGSTIDEHIHQNIPSISYAVTPEYSFRADNGETRPHFTPKLQAERTYGRVSQTGSNYGNTMRFGGTGIERFTTSLKSRRDGRPARKGYAF
jgi:hypothetical protein